MGVDFGAMLIYGFELHYNYDSPDYNEDTEAWQLSEETWNEKYKENIHIFNANYLGDPFYFVGINNPSFHVGFGEVEDVHIPEDKYDIYMAWDEALAMYCSKHGLKFGKPGWKLVATMS